MRSLARAGGGRRDDDEHARQRDAEELGALDETISGTGARAVRRRQGGGDVPTGGRSNPDRTLTECDVFLDDVTVSRRHAELLAEGGRFTIRDLGSLNGTFVNRRRIESTELEDDDEVQIGKYRLTFLHP